MALLAIVDLNGATSDSDRLRLYNTVNRKRQMKESYVETCRS